MSQLALGTCLQGVYKNVAIGLTITRASKKAPRKAYVNLEIQAPYPYIKGVMF